jgi:hypothetical protein
MFARYSKRLALAIGALLVAIGIYAGYWWFYRLAAARRTLDPDWVVSHSQQEFWQEVQKGILRGAWMHDDGYHVGIYGDKSWAEWIMTRTGPDTDMGCFGTYTHSATAMRYLTNHDAGEEAKDWLTWWEKNKNKSQTEWVRDGFKQYGVAVDLEPTTEQTKQLLELLSKLETDEENAIPAYVRYNAFRWLRDSGFQPVACVVSQEDLSAQQAAGMLQYERFLARWPIACNVGVLRLDTDESDRPDYEIPLLTTRFRIGAHLAIWLPTILGICLVAWSLRKRPRNRATTEDAA